MDVGLINGLPGHPLLVHGAVILVPLTALALWRTGYGTVAVWLLGRAGPRRERDRRGGAGSPAEGGASAVARPASSFFVRVVALVIALAVAVGAAIQAYRIGDSGAKAA
ncbi:hypothetical protein ACIQGO_12765 [Streptomyces shenzhenensis]|uniref:hypothetical protein n=1 Tax=Streptomyces shenzhenensis TaxID=943815 RepID=UPI0038043EF2